MVNSNGGAAAEKASACESGGIARPRGAIPGARVGRGANERAVTVAIFAPRGCRGRGGGLRSVCGVAVAVVAPGVVSRARSLRRMGVAAVAVFAPGVVSPSPSLCPRVASRWQSLRRVGVAAVTVFALRVVSRSPSLCHVRCRGRGRCAAWVSPRSPSLHCVWRCSRGRRGCRHCAACGVAVAVVAGAVVAPHVVSRSRSSRSVVAPW
jgi:hypothetical protein